MQLGTWAVWQTDDDMRLTKHHGLGNDFLVLLDDDASHPARCRTWPAPCATGAPASAPTG